MKNWKSYIWLAFMPLIFIGPLLTSEIFDKPPQTKSFEDFVRDVENHNVGELFIEGKSLEVRLLDGTVYGSEGTVTPEMRSSLQEDQVDVRVEDNKSIWWDLLPLSILPIALIGWLIFMAKSGSVGGMEGGVLGMRSSKARTVGADKLITFQEVGGCEEAKREMQDIINFLKVPENFTSKGARMPRGVLLYGPPGTGKTWLARAVAGEAGASFFEVSGSEFVEIYCGVGASRVRDTFTQAQKVAPSVIFIDEIDAIGRSRGSGATPDHAEREQTLNQLLVSIDGFAAKQGIVVMAATNRPDVLDPALLRAGRFDRHIEMPVPDLAMREDVLLIHTRHKPCHGCVSLKRYAEATGGWTSAELETLCNEAALLAARRCENSHDDFEILDDDFEVVLKRRRKVAKPFNHFDVALIQSSMELAEPATRSLVSVLLVGAKEVVGDVLWINEGFMKLRLADGGGELIVAKSQIVQIKALESIGNLDRSDIVVTNHQAVNTAVASQITPI